MVDDCETAGQSDDNDFKFDDSQAPDCQSSATATVHIVAGKDACKCKNCLFI